jgi:ubiquinone/menaquinone biosynthesis C-methylase UbiE
MRRARCGDVVFKDTGPMKRTLFGDTRYAAIFRDAARAERYDAHHGKRARKLGQRLAALLREAGVRGGRVLDAGAGGGHAAVAIAEAMPEANVVGVDLCEPLLQIARDNAKRACVADRVSFVAGDVQKMPFEDDRFEAVVSIDTLHCVDDPVAMVDECERVLAPGGTLLVHNIRRCWAGWLDGVFRTAYTAAEIEQILRRSRLRPWRLTVGFAALRLEAGPRTAARGA